MVFTVDAKRVEQGFHIDRQGELIVLLFDGFDQGLALAAAARVELQQAIASAVQFGFKALTLGAGFVHQHLPGVVVAFVQQGQQARAKLVLQGVAGRAGVEKSVECIVVPLEQTLLRAVLQVRDVQLDDVLLADAVETTDPLFEQIRVGRQIEHHQVMGKLEVTALGTDFRADQYLSTELFISEVRGCTIALQNAHAFMEGAGRDTRAHAQGVFEVHRSFGMGTDDQHFDALEHLQGVDQPLYSRVKAPPAIFFSGVALRLESDFRVQLGLFTNRQFEVFVRASERVGVQLALRETLHCGAGVAKQHTAGAMAVEQFANQPSTRFGIAVVDRSQQGIALGAKKTLDGAMGCRRETTLFEQLLHGFGHRAVVFAFGAKGGQVVETVGVKQAQAGEVAVLAQLLRRGGQQQHARDHFCQLFDQRILRAGFVFMPDQVVSFVDHHQVPAGGEQRVLGLFVFGQPFQRDQRQLGILERVAGIAFDKAFGVEQGDLQVEAAAHFHQPLVLKVFRHQDQDTIGAPRQQLAMDYQPGFDSLAQAYFVGQQYPRCNPVGYFPGNVQLVRDGLRTHAAKAPKRRLQLFAGVFERVVTQREPCERVDLPGEQAIAGQAELDEVRQLSLGQHAGFILAVQAAVHQQAVNVFDFDDGELPVFEMRDDVTWRKPHPGEGSVAQSVLAGLASGRIEYGQQAAVLCQNGA